LLPARRAPRILREPGPPPPAASPPDDPRPILSLRTQGPQTGRLLAAFFPLLERGGSVYCLDGANSFDPYRLTRLARKQGRPPEPLLERLFVSRAYTCHQLVGAVETMLPPLAAAAPPPPVLILGVDRLFLDEDLALNERQYLYERILRRAAALRRRGLPLLITFGGEPASPWARLLERRTRRAADFNQTLARIEERLARVAPLLGAPPHPALLAGAA